MAKFIGTIDDFNKYFDGYCKNTVNKIASKNRRSCKRICQHCGCEAELQSAHVKGEERRAKIKRLLDSYFVLESSYYSVDLKKFEELFVGSHQPIEKHFLFLCPDCHRKYDRADDIRDTALSASIEPVKHTSPDDESGFFKDRTESVQDYVKRLLPMLYDKGMLDSELLHRMQNKEFCKLTFGISWPLLESDPQKIKDRNGHNRYWSDYRLAKRFYVCSQWWKKDFPVYERKLHDWVRPLLSQ